MTIKIGDRIPEASLQHIREGVEIIDTPTLFGGRPVLMFAVPGAFTPTCSEHHLPGYVERMPEFRARGIDVACMAVNDPFVMKAWSQAHSVPDDLRMLSDGNGTFAKALGLDLDASGYGMGTRSRRFALYAEDGVVKVLEVDAPGEFRVTGADHMLTRIDSP